MHLSVSYGLFSSSQSAGGRSESTTSGAATSDASSETLNETTTIHVTFLQPLHLQGNIKEDINILKRNLLSYGAVTLSNVHHIFRYSKARIFAEEIISHLFGMLS